MRTRPSAWLIIFIAALGHSLVAASYGWWKPLTDLHDTRQTFTAIIAQRMLQGGPWLAYEVPLLGPPWSMPHELPVFQWVVALLTGIFNLPLDQTGRAVNFSFYLLCLMPLFRIQGHLGVRRPYRWILLTLFLTSPLYLYWSRTVLMESTALLSSLLFLDFVLMWMNSGRKRWLILIGITAFTAALVKAFTFFGFALAALVLMGIRFKRKELPLQKAAPLAAVGFVIPFLSVLIWNRFSDQQRIQLPMNGENFVSSRFHEWYFGNFWFRFQPSFWNTFLGRVTPDVLGARSMAVVLGAVIFLGKAYRTHALMSVFLFIAVMFVFAHAHQAHNYYQYSNGIFELAGLSFGILGLLHAGKVARIAGILVFGYSLACGLHGYFKNYKPVAQNYYYDPMPMAEAIQRNTAPDEILIIDGWDMSPVLPYYSLRRALTNASRVDTKLENPYLYGTLEKIQGHYRIGALALCFDKKEQILSEKFWAKTGLNQDTRQPFEKCDLYFSRLKSIRSIPRKKLEKIS